MKSYNCLPFTRQKQKVLAGNVAETVRDLSGVHGSVKELTTDSSRYVDALLDDNFGL